LKPPIIVSEPGEVLIFRSTSEVEEYIEWPDVYESRYIAYDSEGRLLKLLSPQGKKPTKFMGITSYNVDEPIRIEPAEVEPGHAHELRELLREHLIHLGEPYESVLDLSLDELLAVAIRRIGFSS
jgi:hypothetical protein